MCEGRPTLDESDEDDWYILPVQPNDTLVVSMTHIPRGANYDIALYTRTITDFVYVAYSTKVENSDEDFTYTIPENARSQYYYLRVIFRDKVASGNIYRLFTSLPRNMLYLPQVFHQAISSAPTCNGFERVDIDQPQQNLAYINTICEAHPPNTPENNDDWYYIYLNQGMTISVDLSGIKSGADYDLYLYRRNRDGYVSMETPLAFSENWGNRNEQITYTADETGQYYIQVVLAEKLVFNNRYYMQVTAK
jgi:hypothetical protein